MSRADALRARLAPDDLIEADLVDQLADASAALESLRSARPAEPDLAWSRHYALQQGIFQKALTALQKLRKSAPAAAPTLSPEAPAAPSMTDTTPEPPVPPPMHRPIDRQARRRLAAFQRASHDRRRQMLDHWPAREESGPPPRSPSPTAARSPAPA